MATWRKVWLWERKGARRTVYVMRWYGLDGSMRCETVGTDARIAESRRRKKEAELNMGDGREAARMRLSAFFEEHLRLMQRQVMPATLKVETSVMARFREFMVAERGAEADPWLEELRPAHGERYLAWRLAQVIGKGKKAHRLSPATANRDVRTLRSIFEAGVRRERFATNPFGRVSRVREERKLLRILSPEDYAALCVECRSRGWLAFISLGLMAGMRCGEIVWLDIADVDFEAGTISVRNKREHRVKNAHERLLPMAPELAAIVRLAIGRRRSGPVLLNSDGRRWTNNLNREFGRIVRRAGIERCRPHDLRATYVTVMAEAGENMETIRRLAGHASIQTTQKSYTRVGFDAMTASAQRVADRMKAVIVPMVTKSSHAPGKRKRAQRA